jgi:hypothetical protein
MFAVPERRTHPTGSWSPECLLPGTSAESLALFANAEYHRDQMRETPSLRPVDVLVACKLYSCEEDRKDWTYASLSADLQISQSTLHASVLRCVRAQVLTTTNLRVHRPRLADLVTVAAPLVFYPERGGLTKGTVTAVVPDAASPRLPFVWAGQGDVPGAEVSPVHPSAPHACAADQRLYEILSLLDVVRVVGGAAAEKAATALRRKICGKAAS